MRQRVILVIEGIIDDDKVSTSEMYYVYNGFATLVAHTKPDTMSMRAALMTYSEAFDRWETVESRGRLGS